MISLAGDTVFITGFPGFIAKRLVEQLATEARRFLLLIQPSFLELARSEIAEISSSLKRSAGDFALIPGDITKSDLDLSPDDLAAARSQTTILFHLAAAYDLAVKRDLAMKVNVQGTLNVNDFARTLPNLRHYHYVSTCYVAGKRKGLILESDLQHEAGFRNYYEETKYLAETSVEKLKTDLPVTIHRPSVVVGDSKTGETVKFDGIYYLILYLLKWPGGLSAFNIGNDDVALNLVPVDFVVQAMTAMARDPEAVGKTVQIADTAPLTTRELFNQIAQAISGRRSRVTVPAWLVQFSLMLPPTPAFSGLPHSAVPYFFIKQTYDTTVSTQLLKKQNIVCPPFEDYVKTIVDYAAANAGKPRTPKPHAT